MRRGGWRGDSQWDAAAAAAGQTVTSPCRSVSDGQRLSITSLNTGASTSPVQKNAGDSRMSADAEESNGSSA